jgi:signal transduction histidine kinase
MQGDLLLAGAALKAHLDETLPPVFGDETQLQQVVRNLLVNACDAVREKQAQERVIDIHTGLDRSGSVELCVQDSGIGILSGMEDKIFELFYTTKSEGQGMGLPICQQIMQSHGGNIVAERLATGGTIFRITLPPYTGGEAL